MAGETRAKAAPETSLVNVHNFARAETDLYFSRMVEKGGFGKFAHYRTPASIDEQDVVRMNRDTLYSSGVFDLDAAPVTITLPDAGKRFMSMQTVSQDHYAIETVYGPGRFKYDRDKVGTRYVNFIVRTLADPEDPKDVAAANALQDAIKVEQASTGSFSVPRWDTASQDRVRKALNELGTLGGVVHLFGKKDEVDVLDHLIGTAMGWGGNPPGAAKYQSLFAPNNDGKAAYRLVLRDVPVDGFWSISVYNAKGYFEKNKPGVYSLNNITAKPNADGSVTIQFGGCGKDTPNCIPIMPGWNYLLRLYRPRKEILSGAWTPPELEPVR